MNEKEIKALIKEAEAAAKRYKAKLNAKSPAPKATKTPSKPKTTAPKVRGGSGMRGPINLGGSGGALGKIK